MNSILKWSSKFKGSTTFLHMQNPRRYMVLGCPLRNYLKTNLANASVEWRKSSKRTVSKYGIHYDVGLNESKNFEKF